MNFQDLFQITKTEQASDLHLKPGTPPTMRVHGKLQPIPNLPPLTAAQTRSIFESITSDRQQLDFNQTKELDFSYQTDGGLRFRVNAHLDRGAVSLAFRRVAKQIPGIEELGLPEICKKLAVEKQGLILVTGPTGSGKSTTLAAMIEELNHQHARRIITIEDPIEYLYTDQKSYITQRELGSDTLSFAAAARQSLRQDPDVILVGEMRDPETMAACLTAAETGHLVLSTLHTNSAAQSIDRIVDSFPPYQQGQIRMQLSLTLLGVLSQRLLPRLDGTGRVPVVEVMVANNPVRNLIREGKTHQLQNVLQTGVSEGMQTRDRALQICYQQGLISIETALANADDTRALRAALH